MTQFRVGIIKKDGDIISSNFDTKEATDSFILEIAERFGVKHYRIMDRETKEVIEKGKDL